MKWVEVKKAKSDGVYLTWSENSAVGMLLLQGGKWIAKTKEGPVRLSEIQMMSIESVMKIVPPKRIII